MKGTSLSLIAVVLTVFILVGRQEAREHAGSRARIDSTDHASLYRSGTLYFRRMGGPRDVWARNLASGQTRRLPEAVSGEPSHHLHGGVRWFLTTRSVPARTGDDGRECVGLCVVSELGQVVQLTDGADIEVAPQTQRWPRHGQDRLVSWVGRRWLDGKVVEGGIYVAELVCDEAGVPCRLVESPRRPLLALELIRESDLDWTPEHSPNIYSYDWSPDGRSLVIESTPQRLFVHDLTDGRTRPLFDGRARDPVWSPRGDRIAFEVSAPFGALVTIHPDGSDAQYILADRAGKLLLDSAAYSSTGEHLAYAALSPENMPDPLAPADLNVYLASADGSRSFNATYDMHELVVPIAWRAN